MECYCNYGFVYTWTFLCGYHCEIFNRDSISFEKNHEESKIENKNHVGVKS
jgi:hypothetical protein